MNDLLALASPDEFAIITFALFLGGLTKGVIGMALPVIGIAIMVVVIEPLQAIAIMVFPIVLTNFWQAARGGLQRLHEPAKRFWPLVISCLIVMFFTSWYATYFSTSLLFFLMGFVLIFFVVTNYMKPSLALPPRYDRPAAILAGAASGLLGGATAVYGPPINIYLSALHLPKAEWIRAIGFTYAFAGLPLIAGYGLNGMLNKTTIPLSLLACLPAMAGLFIGRSVQDRIPQNAFRQLMFLVLILLGLNFLRRAIW